MTTVNTGSPPMESVLLCSSGVHNTRYTSVDFRGRGVVRPALTATAAPGLGGGCMYTERGQFLVAAVFKKKLNAMIALG